MTTGRPLVLLLLALVLVGTGRIAQADDWSDARKEFRSWMKSERYQERQAAFLGLLDFDGEKAFQEALSATLREKNPAVVVTGIKTLGEFETPEAQAALLAELKRPKGEKGLVLLMALYHQKGEASTDRLIEILAGKDSQHAALAAIALGQKAVERSLPALLRALGHKEWQVVSAAARAIKRIAWSSWTKPSKERPAAKKPAMPSWFDPKKVLWPLIDTLETVEGAARGDVIRALESVTKKDYGNNYPAWVAHADGKEVTKALLRKRVRPPYFFGIPVHGRRIAIVMGVNVLGDNEHPFKDRKRLQELCAVPGGRDVPWFKLRSIKQFNSAWVKRLIQDMPTKGQRFDLIFSGLKTNHVFGKLTPSNAGTKNKAIVELEKVPVENGNDVLSAMTQALDVSGSKDSVAWSKGPDEVVCVYSSIPWQAEVTSAEIVGATIGLKARRRLVKVHAVGVHEYAYAMMKLFAHQTGGVYLELTR